MVRITIFSFYRFVLIEKKFALRDAANSLKMAILPPKTKFQYAMSGNGRCGVGKRGKQRGLGRDLHRERERLLSLCWVRCSRPLQCALCIVQPIRLSLPFLRAFPETLIRLPHLHGRGATDQTCCFFELTMTDMEWK